MKKINLSITGSLGRMGNQIIKTSKLDKSFRIVSLTENKKINKRIIGITPQLNSEIAFRKTDVIIDFILHFFQNLVYHEDFVLKVGFL